MLWRRVVLYDSHLRSAHAKGLDEGKQRIKISLIRYFPLERNQTTARCNGGRSRNTLLQVKGMHSKLYLRKSTTLLASNILKVHKV